MQFWKIWVKYERHGFLLTSCGSRHADGENAPYVSLPSRSLSLDVYNRDAALGCRRYIQRKKGSRRLSPKTTLPPREIAFFLFHPSKAHAFETPQWHHSKPLTGAFPLPLA